jgi:hypothetical protein
VNTTNDTGREPDDEPIGAMIRPYTVTGGRTETRIPLGLTTQIRTITSPERSGRHHRRNTAGVLLFREHRAIIEECRHSRAVVDLASTLHVPISVAKVLVGDLINDGYLVALLDEDTHSIAFLQRVKDGIERAL